MDFCAGWGGRLVGACALNLAKYIGVDINSSLKEPYTGLVEFMKETSSTEVDMIFDDALNVDYAKLEYDTAFTSPPYYFIQKYENNIIYKTKDDMNINFYIPIFTKTYNGLQVGGHYIINVCKEVYDNVLIKLFGEAHEIYPYKKSKRQNNYNELVYVWIKTK